MELKRENILTLIGKKKYHSCVITTFSFDFDFFEMKAQKCLRLAGVRNVNIFMDGLYYSEIMKKKTGDVKDFTPSYSLYPVFQKSIFHPKIWMLFGEDDGLLIIGSGNLTHSGNGSNDEIWGAFHFNIFFPENASIFSSAWHYISTISSTTKSQVNEKTSKWIYEKSPWLNNLPVGKPFQFSDSSNKDKIAFLFNSESSSIWEELLNYIKNEDIIKITTISPFYDKNGTALQVLNTAFPSAKINVVLDETGLIPSGMQINDAFTFYDWKDLGVSKSQSSEYGNSKLHAKIIHFKTKNKKEFCLMGSANVTPEGLGLLERKESNSEASILIQSDEGGLLSKLGIKLVNKKKLSEFKAITRDTIYQKIIKNNQFKIKLILAELAYDELTFYSDGTYPEQFKIIFTNNQNKPIHTEQIPEYKQELKLNLELKEARYAQFEGINGEAISNKIIISDYILLAKTNSNNKSSELDGHINEIQNGDLSRYFDLLHYAMIDNTEYDSAVVLSNNKVNEVKKEEKKGPEELYDLSTYKQIDNTLKEKKHIISSLSLKVYEAVKMVNSKGLGTNIYDDISIDEQNENIAIIDGNEENEVKRIIKHTSLSLKREKKKLNNYIANIYNYQHEILYGKERPEIYDPSFTDILRYLILIQYMADYGGKTEKYDEDEKQQHFNYLPFSNQYDNDNVKGCCLNIIGDFLMLVRKGFKKYEFEYTIKKFKELKNEAFVNTIVCILNNNWKDQELPYFKTLLLNTLHFLGWKEIENFDENFESLIHEIYLRKSGLKNKVKDLEGNYKYFIETVYPKFTSVIKRLPDIKGFDSVGHKGQIIYKSRWGYCFIKSVTNSSELTLSRPGFKWDEKSEDYISHNTNEIYLPLKLSKFICTGL